MNGISIPRGTQILGEHRGQIGTTHGSVASLAANVAVAEPTVKGRVLAAWPSFSLIAADACSPRDRCVPGPWRMSFRSSRTAGAGGHAIRPGCEIGT
jgi:hypothetical protein